MDSDRNKMVRMSHDMTDVQPPTSTIPSKDEKKKKSPLKKHLRRVDILDPSPEVKKDNVVNKKVEELDYNSGDVELFKKIEDKKFDEALLLLKTSTRKKKTRLSGIEQANTWVIRKGSDGSIRWRMLPIHAAITHGAPLELVKALISAVPSSLKSKDHRGQIPLHIAFHKSQDEVVRLIINACPECFYIEDKKGRLPYDRAPSTYTTQIIDFMEMMGVFSDDSQNDDRNDNEIRNEHSEGKDYMKEYEDDRNDSETNNYTEEIHDEEGNKKSRNDPTDELIFDMNKKFESIIESTAEYVDLSEHVVKSDDKETKEFSDETENQEGEPAQQDLDMYEEHDEMDSALISVRENDLNDIVKLMNQVLDKSSDKNGGTSKALQKIDDQNNTDTNIEKEIITICPKVNKDVSKETDENTSNVNILQDVENEVEEDFGSKAENEGNANEEREEKQTLQGKIKIKKIETFDADELWNIVTNNVSGRNVTHDETESQEQEEMFETSSVLVKKIMSITNREVETESIEQIEEDNVKDVKIADPALVEMSTKEELKVTIDTNIANEEKEIDDTTDLNKQMNILQKMNVELRAELEKLKEENKGRCIKVEEQNEFIKSLNSEIHELTKQNIAIKGLQEQKVSIENKHSNASDNGESDDESKSEMHEIVEKLRKEEQNHLDSLSRINELVEKNNKQEEEYNLLKEQMITLKAQHEMKLSELTRLKDTNETRITNSLRSMQDLKDKLALCESDYDEAKEKIAELKGETKIIPLLCQSTSRLLERLSIFVEEGDEKLIASIKESLMTDEGVKREDNFIDIQGKIETLNEKLAEKVVREKNLIDKLLHKNEVVNKKLDSSMADSTKAMNEIIRLQDEIENNKKQSVDEVSELSKLLKSKENECEEQLVKIKKLEKDCSKIGRLKKEKEYAEEKLTYLKAEHYSALETFSSKEEKNKVDMIKVRSEMKQLNDELEEAKSETDKANQKILALEKEAKKIPELKEIMVEVTRELEDKELRYEGAKQQIEKLNGNNQRLLKNIERVNETNMELLESRDTWKRRAKMAKNEFLIIRETLRRARDCLQECEDTIFNQKVKLEVNKKQKVEMIHKFLYKPLSREELLAEIEPEEEKVETVQLAPVMKDIDKVLEKQVQTLEQSASGGNPSFGHSSNVKAQEKSVAENQSCSVAASQKKKKTLKKKFTSSFFRKTKE